MKLLETFRKNFALVGISSNQSSLDFWIKSLMSINLWSGCIVGWITVISEANSFVEYTMTICTATAATFIAINFTNYVFLTKKIFRVIEEYDKTIENGEFNEIKSNGYFN